MSIDIAAISEIRSRIASIENTYSPKPSQDHFSKKLAKELAKIGVAEHVSKIATDNNHIKAKQNINTVYTQKATLNTDNSLQNINHLLSQAAKKYNIDPKLLMAVAEVESGLNQGVVSSAGAIGIMQLMPTTAGEMGVNPYDTKENIEGGAKYLRDLLDSFGGDVAKALAAYNAGPNAVRYYGTVPPYSETQNYVNNVLDLYQ